MKADDKKGHKTVTKTKTTHKVGAPATSSTTVTTETKK